ncbi:MAG: hypothetical protein ISR81_07420 [Nitrosopumilus sp.]|nr:hypothetical protein [Nitrosopumilus sp.]MBL7018725.1 hypothetical protein [Nitrosopumilus sp.]
MTSFSSLDLFQESSGISTTGSDIGLNGHVTVVHKDPEGNVLSYSQYDNVITNQGLHCATRTLFATTNGTCAMASATDDFDFIGLLADGQTADAADVVGETVTGGGLDPAVATTIGIDVVAAGSGTTTGNVVTGIQKTFTKVNATQAIIAGATLQTGAADAVFATKLFTGGDVTLNENDTLQITWTITLGN